MESCGIKEEAHHLVDKMHEESTWDDLMYEIYVRQVVDAGLADSKAGRTIDVEEVRRRFGLPRSVRRVHAPHAEAAYRPPTRVGGASAQHDGK